MRRMEKEIERQNLFYIGFLELITIFTFLWIVVNYWLIKDVKNVDDLYLLHVNTCKNIKIGYIKSFVFRKQILLYRLYHGKIYIGHV
jgi:hypothetical protein